jgi:hypothetical protein
MSNYAAKQVALSASVKQERGVNAVSVRMAILLAGLMSCIIAGTVFGGKGIAFASIPCLIAAVTLSAISRPVLALTVYFTYTCLEGMYKYLSDFSQVVYIIKPILAVVIVAAWVFSRGMTGRHIVKPPLAAIILFWMAWGCVEIFFPTGAGVVGSTVTFMTWYLLPVALYFLTYDCVKKYSQAHVIVTALMLLSTVISGFALVQYGMGREWTIAHLPGYQNITQHNWWITSSNGQIQGTSWSPASTTSYSGIACTWSNIGAILALGLLLSPTTGSTGKIWLSVCLVTNVMSLLISGGRTYVILFPLEALLLFVLGLRLQKNPLHTVGAAILFILVIAIGYNVAQNMTKGLAAGRYAATASNPFGRFAEDRGGNFTSLGTFIPEYPLGVGYQRGTDSGDNVQSLILANRETEFGAIAADMGIPGVILLVTVVGALLWKGWRSCTAMKTPRNAMFALTIFVLLLGNVISFLGAPTIEGADYFWVLFGILLALPRIEKRGEIPVARSISRNVDVSLGPSQ